MSEQLMPSQSRVVQIGPDRVTVSDKELVIEVRREMEGWAVRDFNSVPIYFEDRKYYLVQKLKTQPPYAFRYVLLPWADGQQTNTKIFFAYDLDAVNERDAGHRTGARIDLVHAFLCPLYPFLGLLWSKTQDRLGRFDFVPRSITSISIFTVFCAIFTQGVFLAMSMNATIRSGKLMIGGMICALAPHDHVKLGSYSFPLMILDGLMILVCLADIGVRYNNYLRDEEWYGGFLEWVIPKSGRRK